MLPADPLQQRILDILDASQTPVPASKIYEALGKNTDVSRIDCALGGLKRAGKAHLDDNCYSAKKAPRVLAVLTDVGEQKVQERTCNRCHVPKPLDTEFEKLRNGQRARRCNVCRSREAQTLQDKKATAIKVTAPVVDRGRDPLFDSISAFTGCATSPGNDVPTPEPTTREARRHCLPAEAQPVIGNHVFERLRNEHQNDLNRIAALEADLTELRTRVVKRQQFFSLYEELAQGVG